MAKGLSFDLMEKFLKFRINGWPVYKASSLLVHCPLISGEGEGVGGGGSGGGVVAQPLAPDAQHETKNSFLNQTQVN